MRSFSYPKLPWLGDRLFRVRPSNGAFAPDDFSAFADAATLYRHNVSFLGYDAGAAETGDLLFFRGAARGRQPFHGMIYLGPEEGLVVYHTGNSVEKSGSVRLVRLSDLAKHPDLAWRPLTYNRAFLGFFRFKFLD